MPLLLILTVFHGFAWHYVSKKRWDSGDWMLVGSSILVALAWIQVFRGVPFD